MAKTFQFNDLRTRLIHASGASIRLNLKQRLEIAPDHLLIRHEMRHQSVKIKRAQALSILRRLTRTRGQSSAAGRDLLLQQLDLPRNYSVSHRLNPIADADFLVSNERDRYQRTLWLHPKAASALAAMRRAAALVGVRLEVISAFRSTAYQNQLIQRKRARGQRAEQIMQVSAAPGFSEHHSGCALDFVDENSEPLTEAFESSAAFAWLTEHAGRFGFVMSFPKDNEHGVLYEPWHWCYQLKKNSAQRRKRAKHTRFDAAAVFHLQKRLAKRAR